MDKYQHSWDFCGLCNKPFVRCGCCGNNCCSGTEECSECHVAYYKQSNEPPPDFNEEYKNKKIEDYHKLVDNIFGDE